jgi:hypothetical protein
VLRKGQVAWCLGRERIAGCFGKGLVTWVFGKRDHKMKDINYHIFILHSYK